MDRVISHWTKVKTQIKDIGALKKALDRMGLEYQVGDHKITQYGTTEKAEIRLDDAVGFSRQKDGTFAMVGDFYHSRNRKLSKYYGNTNKFQSDIQTAYAVEETILRMEEQQFFCSENSDAKADANGIIRMTFERY